MKDTSKLLVLLLLLGSFISIESCKKDFLSSKPLSFYSPDAVFADESGFQSALITVRKELMNDFLGNWNPNVADVSSTDIGGQAFAMDWRTITPSTGTYLPILPYFGQVYGYIKNTNVIISRINEINWDDLQEKDRILAEALFYRSYWYYRLVHSYGDIPWIGEELKGAKVDFETNYKFSITSKIQKDLEFSVNNLPEKTDAFERPTKYAALQLLSKVYMDNLEFQKAVDAATEIINGPFELIDHRFGVDKDKAYRNYIWDLHRPANKAISENTEAIFCVINREDAPDDAKIKSYTMRAFTPTWWHSVVKDSEGKHGTLDVFSDGSYTPQYDTLGRGNPDMVTDPWYNYDVWKDGSYTWKNTPDLRRVEGNWINNDGILYNNPTSVDYGKPLDPHNFDNLSDSLTTIFPISWYKVWYPHPEGFTGAIMGGYGDSYVYRLAETYLIRAEAHFWNGEPSLAAEDLNKVRGRSHASIINAGDVTLDFIFDERARELFIEEKRHTELIRASFIMARLKQGGYSMDNFATHNWYFDRVMSRNQFFQLGTISTRVFHIEPYNALWPIDVNVITVNTLGHINQNEGYTGSENNIEPIKEEIPTTEY